MEVMTIFGTRPEAIKMTPVIKELEKYQDDITSLVCITAQHKELLHPFLELFKVEPYYDLDIMRSNQSFFDLTASALIKLKEILKNENPEIILVQGDTTTAFVASLAGFYSRIKIAHVEAGLRSYNKYNPFSEEMNRKIIDSLSDICFAPTETAKNNLLKEGIQEEAPSLGKPVLVMRKTTERPEAVKAGIAKLVGTDKESIVRETQRLLMDKEKFERIAKGANPYGDGKAAQRIVEVIRNWPICE